MRKFVAILTAVLMGGSSTPVHADISSGTVSAVSYGNTPPAPSDAITEGLWWLYQMNYERAHQNFADYSVAHPDDPAGFFYMAACDWWQLAQEFDFKLPKIEERFEADYRESCRVGREALSSANDDHARALACLYWGGAEGLKGRWLVTQKEYLKAYVLGKRGNKLLHRAIKYDPTLYDAYMGIGVYDYFTDTLSGIVRAFSALLIHGDRKRGMQELQVAIDKGQRARVESMVFMIEIYTTDENIPEKALPLTQQLREEFPQSAAMHLAEIMALYRMNRWVDVEREANVFLENSKKEVPYYSHAGVRPGEYCLGVAMMLGHRDFRKAEAYFHDILSTKNESRWVTFALLREGQLSDLRGQRKEALEAYREVLNRPDFWGSRRDAQQSIDQPFTLPAENK